LIATRREPVILVHFDPRLGAEGNQVAGAYRAQTEAELLDRVFSYAAWASRSSGRACLLLPETLRRPVQSGAEKHVRRTIFYRDEADLCFPSVSRKEPIWIINGWRLPELSLESPWSDTHRQEREVTIFAPRSDTPHYTESVCVDEGGRVLGFRRHYCDSPAFADRWSGEAAALFTTGAHLQAAAAHLVVHGWGLKSIGLLSRRFSVGWADLPAADDVPTGRRFALSAGEHENDLLVGAMPWPVPSLDPPELAPIRGPSLPDQVVEEKTTAPEFRRRPGYEWAKRVLDLSAASVGLLLISPFLLLVSALVKCTSRGPVFFVHRRQGVNGKEFSCIKFRTMTLGAHEMQNSLRAFNEVDGPQFKIDHDPRLTKLGGWLRRLNIDELPQLFNVLLGPMSLVGPRPSPDDENQLCPAWRRVRLSVKPGMTGLWQVLRRRTDPDMDFQEWIYYDVEYAKHRCLWLDLQILLHTPWAIFASHRLGKFVARLQRRGICRHAGEMGWTRPVPSK